VRSEKEVKDLRWKKSLLQHVSFSKSIYSGPQGGKVWV
jgi:hypothetical protein